MRINEKSCSALTTGEGTYCIHGHATTGACFGSGYPSGIPIPVCVREDKRFDEELKRVTIEKWEGL